MLSQATRKRDPERHVIPREERHVFVPSLIARPVKDAHSTVDDLLSITPRLKAITAKAAKLAGSDATLFSVPVLQGAYDVRYLLAVDSRGLPEREGWYLIKRSISRNTITFIPKEHQEVDGLLRTGRVFGTLSSNVLHVERGAIEAKADGRPIALSVDFYRSGHRGIDAVDWPNTNALVVLSGRNAATRPLSLGEQVDGIVRNIDRGLAEAQRR